MIYMRILADTYLVWRSMLLPQMQMRWGCVRHVNDRASQSFSGHGLCVCVCVARVFRFGVLPPRRQSPQPFKMSPAPLAQRTSATLPMRQTYRRLSHEHRAACTQSNLWRCLSALLRFRFQAPVAAAAEAFEAVNILRPVEERMQPVH